MPKPPKGSRLGSGPAHEKLMLAGLAAALFREERIRTTDAKARRLRPVAERLITNAKDGSIASRRRALQLVTDKDVIHKLFSDIGPRFADRPGGYTRIIKLAPRKGDAAPLVLIELVEGAAPEAKPAEEERRRRLLRRRGRAERGAGEEAEESEPKASAKAPAGPSAGPSAGVEAHPESSTESSASPEDEETPEPSA